MSCTSWTSGRSPVDILYVAEPSRRGHRQPAGRWTLSGRVVGEEAKNHKNTLHTYVLQFSAAAFFSRGISSIQRPLLKRRTPHSSLMLVGLFPIEEPIWVYRPTSPTWWVHLAPLGVEPLAQRVEPVPINGRQETKGSQVCFPKRVLAAKFFVTHLIYIYIHTYKVIHIYILIL